jgi:signal transduction histidine kinase
MDAKTRFISMISYEFRTPLTAIKEGVDIVLKGTAGKISDEQKKLLDLARKSGENLSHLVSDIIDFHKLETNKILFDMKKNDINEVVAEVQKNMVPLLTEKKEIKLLVKLDKEIPKAMFDKERIILVLTNIVNVAVKSAEKGDVTVITEKEGTGAIRVSINDPETVIAGEALPKLFQEFNEQGGVQDKKAGGSGLGLAISKEIIERHNGRIWAESGEKKGTTFNFVLPISGEKT